MQIFKNQYLAGTKIDLQGEKIPKHVLEDFVQNSNGSRIPLNQSHDFGKKSPGYIANIKLVEDVTEKNEWVLFGDVYCEIDILEEALGGFSISYLEISHRSVDEYEFIMYLPFPHYNDEAYIESFTSQNKVSVGRWVKKAADPSTSALIVAAVIFFIKPVWDDYYKTQLAPKIYSFIKKNHESLQTKKISTDFVQTVEFKGKDIQVILTPKKEHEIECFTPDKLNKAMFVVAKFLNDTESSLEIKRINMYFHDETVGFKIHRSENENGNVIHYV